MTLVLRHLLALGGGILLWSAFPDANLWPLAPVGVAAVTLATRGAPVALGTWLGFVAGMAWMTPMLAWSSLYAGLPPWLALSALQALFVAVTGGLLSAVQQSTWGRRPLVTSGLGACAWVVGETLRGTVPFGGFPWVRLAFSQADSPVLGLVRYVGAPGLSFVVALAGGLLSVAVAGVSLGAARRALAAAAVVLLLGGPALLPRPVEGVRQVAVAAVQGNAPDTGPRFNERAREVLLNHVVGTEAVARRASRGDAARPDVVFWPENASDVDPLRDPSASLLIDRAVRSVGTTVVVGAVLDEPDTRNTNAALVYAPGEGVVGRYDKQHVVPFGEYIPYRELFRRLDPQVDMIGTFVGGTRPGLLDVPLRDGSTLPVGVGICFEVAYDGLMRGPVLDGAQVLFVPTNNVHFGHTAESTQQLAISRVRAVELGRSVVHISTVGVSALITPDGVAHDRTDLFTAAQLQRSLPARTEITPAARLRRAPEAVICLVGVLGAIASVGTARSRRRRHVRPGRERFARPAG